MAAQDKVTFKQDLTEPVKIRHYEGVVFTGDDCGNLIKVALFDGGVPYSGGGTVSATAVLADGTTFPLTQGSITGNMVSVPLEAGALVVSGLMGLYVKISGGGIICTVLNAIFTVQATDTGMVPAAMVTTVNELVQEIKDAQDSFPADLTNLLAAVAPTFSTSKAYSAGAYAWQGGKLYRFTAAHPAGTWTGTDAVAVALGNDVSDLKSAVEDAIEPMLTNAYKSQYLWEQGYYAIANGGKTFANDWIRTKRYIGADIAFINAPSTYYMYLMAYDTDDTYIGAWNQSTFSKTYSAGTGLHEINVSAFRKAYPGYKFQISLVVSSGTAITPANTGANVSFVAYLLDFYSRYEGVESAINGSFNIPKMGEYYENFEISNEQNSYVLYPNTGTPVLTRARIKQSSIQPVPNGATYCTVTLAESIFASGKYRVGFAFYTNNFVQISGTGVGWITEPRIFIAPVVENAAYYMLYIATNSASTVDLNDISNDGCSVVFDNTPVNYIWCERMAAQRIPDILVAQNQTANVADYAKSMGLTSLSNVRMINHRGYNVVAPENTIVAFEMSAEKGYKYVETDVLFTAPDETNTLGVPVLLHDASINRTARNADGSAISGTINIADITYAQALEYDFGIYKGAAFAGTKIPTFDEFIKACKRLGLHPYIELKNEKTYSQDEIDMILSIIVANGMKKNVSFISYDATALTLVKNRWDWVELGINASAGISACLALKTDKNEVFVVHYKSMTITAFMEAEIPACPYTVDTITQLQGLNPYYSMILTDGLTPIQVYENMFSAE